MKKKATNVSARSELRRFSLLAESGTRDFIAAMQRRLGGTPAQQLAWIVEFSQRDFTALRPEELIALGHDLRAIAALYLGRGQMTTPLEPMPPERIAAHQLEIADGMRRLLDQKEARWPLPETLRPVLALTTGPRSPARNYFRIRFEGDERGSILGAVAQLLQLAGEHLRVCDECRRPFVAVKRQEYCSSSCAWRTRNKRREQRKRTAALRASKGLKPARQPGKKKGR